MQLSEIDFSRLEAVVYRSKQVARLTAKTGEPPRLIYRDGDLFYKVWNAGNLDHRSVYWDGRQRLVRNRDESGRPILLGFLYGLYDESVCPAFVDHIWEGDRLAGYVTRAGEVPDAIDPDNPIHAEFLDRILRLTLESGFVYRDLKAANTVMLADGRLSLIDLEPPPVLLNRYSVERETFNGSLAGFTHPTYRRFLKAYLDTENRDPEIRRARERFASALPDRFVLAIDDRPPSTD